ncbi:ZP domain-containing protein [Trichonephila clavipes]|nr:ZP domain-containing protein [Trichonephila clavipes]
MKPVICTGIVEEELPPPKAPSSSQTTEVGSAPSGLLPARFEYLIGGAALVVSLLISVCVNVYLLIFIKKKLEKSSDEESNCPPSIHEAPFVDSLYRSNLYDRYNPREELYVTTKDRAVHRRQPLRVVVVEVTVIEGIASVQRRYHIFSKQKVNLCPSFLLGTDRRWSYHVEWSATPPTIARRIGVVL